MGYSSAEDQADEALKMNETLMYKAQQISSFSVRPMSLRGVSGRPHLVEAFHPELRS
jgi:hypothetical protein